MLPVPPHVLPLPCTCSIGSPRARLEVCLFVFLEIGVVEPPLCPFATTCITALPARNHVRLPLAQLPPRLIMEMGSGIRPLLLLGGLFQGANRMICSPHMQHLPPPPPVLIRIGRVDILVTSPNFANLL